MIQGLREDSSMERRLKVQRRFKDSENLTQVWRKDSRFREDSRIERRDDSSNGEKTQGWRVDPRMKRKLKDGEKTQGLEKTQGWREDSRFRENSTIWREDSRFREDSRMERRLKV